MDTAVDCITLNVLGPGNTMFHFTTKKHIRLSKIMNVYCEESGLAFSKVKFNFDGRTINEIDTPTSLNLVDGDTIEVFQWQNGSGYF
ncbi:small ubiquitin-related modifier 2-like [Aphis gossypii]|nr:small ubiquitin-related modifier 2-like [Aphis gossypii]